MERYEKYKNSGVEWIGEIPEGWEVKKLKYVADANPSNIDKKSKENEKTILLCNYVDVYKNEIISSELNFMKATASNDQIKKFILEKGDVIITKDSETPDDIAAPALVAENFDNVVCGYHLTHIKPRKISGYYLFRYIQSKYLNSYFEVSANGVTRYGLSVDKINSALILNPPRTDQTAIANYLDRKTAEIDELIAQKERLLELYEEEKTAIINQAVTKGIDPDVKLKDSGIGWLGEIPEGWEVKKLKYVANVVLGKMLTNKDKGGYEKRKYLRAANIEWLCVNVSDVKEMWFSGDELARLRINEGDLLVSEGGEVGRSCIWKNELDECYIQNSVHKISFENSNNSIYFLNLFFIMGQKGFFDSIVNRISIAHLTGAKLKEIYVVCPPPEAQIAIVHHIETETARINAKIARIKKIIELQKEYRTALISEVVTGKIKVPEEVVS